MNTKPNLNQRNSYSLNLNLNLALHNQSESLPLVLQPGFCWCPNTSTPTQTWLGMPQNKFHFRLHCVPSKIAIYLLHTSTVIQTTTSIQHLTKREVILALPGWPLIRSAWLAVTKLPVFLSSCLHVFMSSCLPAQSTSSALPHIASSVPRVVRTEQNLRKIDKKNSEIHNKITLVDRKNRSNRILPVDFFIKLYSTERWVLATVSSLSPQEGNF